MKPIKTLVERIIEAKNNLKLQDKVRGLYASNEVVSVCMFSFKDYQEKYNSKLKHLIDGKEVMMIPPIDNYRMYSHGICEDCLEKYYPKVHDKYVNKDD